MGATLLAVKQSFLSSMTSLQPTAASQFVVWLDEKVSEYKVNGSMNLQLKKDTPNWIKEYNMAILLNDEESPMDHSNALIPHSIERLNQVKESRKRLIRPVDTMFTPPVKVRKRITDKMIAEFSHYANYASQLTQSQIASGLTPHSLLSASPSMVPNISAYGRVSDADLNDKRTDVRNVERKDGQSTDLSAMSEVKTEDVDETGYSSYSDEFKESSPADEHDSSADIRVSTAGSPNQQKEGSMLDQTCEATIVTQSMTSKMMEELAQFGFPSLVSQNQGLDSYASIPAASVLPNSDAGKDGRSLESASLESGENDNSGQTADVNNFRLNREQDMLDMGATTIKIENMSSLADSNQEHSDTVGMMHFNPEQTVAVGTLNVKPESGKDNSDESDEDDDDIGPNFFEEPDDDHKPERTISTAVSTGLTFQSSALISAEQLPSPVRHETIVHQKLGMPMNQPAPVIPLFTRPIKFRAAMRKPIRRKMLEADLPHTEAMVLSDPNGASTSDYRAPAMPTPAGMIDGLCTGNVVTCSYCCKAFKSLNSLRDHVRCIHVLMPQYACPQCGKTFRWRSSYWRHTKSCTYKINYTNTLPEKS